MMVLAHKFMLAWNMRRWNRQDDGLPRPRLHDAGVTAPLSAVIISPTRDLASQIKVEAERLLAGIRLPVGIVMGGTNINKDKSALQTNLLVAVRISLSPSCLGEHVD
jgi:superfamily II DNA/RNA helicase